MQRIDLQVLLVSFVSEDNCPVSTEPDETRAATCKTGARSDQVVPPISPGLETWQCAGAINDKDGVGKDLGNARDLQGGR